MSSDRVLLEAMYNSAASAMEREGVGDKTFIREAMDSLRYLIQRDDRGWVPIYGGQEPGNSLAINLEMLKRWEQDISETTIAASWMKRGLTLRHGYIWSGGIRYGDIPEGGSQGVRNLKKYVNDKDNVYNFFGHDARRRREARLYYSGIALYLGHDKTKKITALPLHQITDQILAPDGTGEVWAYKREWSERNLETGATDDKKMWYFTHRAVGNRVERIKEGDGYVPVSQVERIFDLHANRIEGMAYGSPDALAAYAWHKVARNAYLDGISMQEALASFAFQVTNKSGGGARQSSLQMANPVPAGSTAVVGQNELQSIASAGKGYDFGSLTPVLAIVATSLDVSVIHLSASPGDAGSSYSAAETMDLPTRLAMSTRRDLHVDFDKQVLEWIGVSDPEVFFAPFESGTETYRNIQALILAAQAGAYSVKELRNMIDDLLALPNGTPPEGAMEYNNEKTLKIQAKVKTDSAPAPAPAPAQDGEQPGGNSSVASPAQGRSNGTGGQTGGNATNDLRDA